MSKSFSRKWVRLTLVLTAVLLLTGLLSLGCAGETAGDGEEKICKVGVIGPFTGPAARTGEEFKNSINMAFEEIDYKVGDYKIEFVWVDSESDAEKAARAYEQAIVKDKIDVGFMDWHSWVSVSCMDIAAKHKMPHFFGFGAVDTVNEKIEEDFEKYKYWVGKAWPKAELLTKGYIEAVSESIEKGIWTPKNEKFAIYGVDNDWGRNFGNAIRDQFQEIGWELTSESWVALGETDFYPMLSKIKKEGASVIAGTMSDPPSVIAFIKQTREVGLDSMIICDGLGWVGEWYDICGDASDFVIDQIPQWTTPEARKFRDDFTEKYGFEPGPSAAGMCYDWAHFFIKVMELTLEEHGDLSTESFAKVAEEYVIPGKLSYTDGIIHKEYKFTPETFPDPVVDQEHYIFPVIQYFGGEGKMIWPDEWKDQDMKIPEWVK